MYLVANHRGVERHPRKFTALKLYFIIEKNKKHKEHEESLFSKNIKMIFSTFS